MRRGQRGDNGSFSTRSFDSGLILSDLGHSQDAPSGTVFWPEVNFRKPGGALESKERRQPSVPQEVVSG